MTKNHSINQGFILPVLLFTVTFVMILITVTASLSLTGYNLATREAYKVNAQLVADAGLDLAVSQINEDEDWTGTGGEVELMDSGNIRSTYETVVTTAADGESKTVSVTGRTYSPSGSATPKITRKYEVDVVAVTSGTGASSVVSGVGGLILGNNAKITGGDVVVNGRVTMSNNSQIGLSTNAVNVRVAHQSCPQPATSAYPQVCGPGNGQPITMGSNSRIYADVRATNQTTGTNMSNPGLVAGETFDPIDLPTYDRDAQKAAVTTTVNASSIPCGNNGTRTWAANTKIVGTPTIGNNCTITVQGNVWVTGNINLGNNARIIIANTAAQPPTIMVDGSGGFVFGNNAQIIPNNTGKGAQVITYWSAASCSPDCATVTGTSLYSSQNTTTINLSNNGSAPNTVLWAAWSRVVVSNNGAIGAVTGQTINLGNNAVINFTATVPGSDNLVRTWVKRGYMRVFD